MKKGRIKPGIVVAGITAIGGIFGLILDVVCGRYEEKMMKEEIDAAVDKKVNEIFDNSSEDDEENEDNED